MGLFLTRRTTGPCRPEEIRHVIADLHKTLQAEERKCITSWNAHRNIKWMGSLAPRVGALEVDWKVYATRATGSPKVVYEL
jgi:hypothetical protein